MDSNITLTPLVASYKFPAPQSLSNSKAETVKLDRTQSYTFLQPASQHEWMTSEKQGSLVGSPTVKLDANTSHPPSSCSNDKVMKLLAKTQSENEALRKENQELR